MKYDAVLNGGSVRGSALVGAISAIEEKGFTPSHFIGSSAGSIVAALRIAGYTPDELKQVMLDLDFEQFLDGSKWIPMSYKMFEYQGIHPGKAFLNWMTEMLKKKNVSTFKDLKIGPEYTSLQAQEPRYQYRLSVTATDLSNSRLAVFPQDANLYGFTPDTMPVALAIRASMSIPYFFEPVQLNGNYLVDGGVVSNFPLWYFDSDNPDHPTFGLLLQRPSDKPVKISGNIDFIKALVDTWLCANDKRSLRPEEFSHRTIPIPTGDIGTFDFDMTKLEKEWLFSMGYQAGSRFMQSWSWGDYLRWVQKT